MSKARNIFIVCALLGVFVAAYLLYTNMNEGKEFTITNLCDFGRYNELVEISYAQLGISRGDNFILVDSLEREVAYQKTETSLLFQANVAAKSSSRYKIKHGTPAAPIYTVFARFVPERKDDFAWENDIAAYRMYGPALAAENPSNGVDLWLKKTDELIVDTFYYREHELGLPYHIDYGKGLDCYKVGHTVGCGGVALLLKDSLYVGNHYDSWEIVEEGPLRTQFILVYDSMRVGKQYVRETLRVTVEAGSVVNRADVIFETIDGSALPTDMSIAAGIYLHDGEGVIKNDVPSNRWIAYAEDAVSDAGLDEGRNYVGVIMPQSDGVQVISNSLVLYHTCNDRTDKAEMTYYFGGGWSQWLFETDHDWFEAISRKEISLDSPLQIASVQQ